MSKRAHHASVEKASVFSIVINAIELAMMAVVLGYVLFTDPAQRNPLLADFFISLAVLVTGAGAAFDIRDALYTRRLLKQVDDMDDTIGDMADLNNTLRAQRHDFLNHLQVVYSLMEMEEYGEANAYIEKVYGSITSVSRALKTANPAVNALLQVKLAACEKAGVKAETNITSAWRDLPLPGWEMCKVLSNLIDNAIDALQEVEDRRLTLTLTEDLHAFRFTVANNGPMIPVRSQQTIFLPGVSTKNAGPGHGMGLYIVRKTLQEHGGDIELVSDAEHTAFSGWVPKEITRQEPAA